MGINENLTEFGGKPVVDFTMADTTFNVNKHTPRIRVRNSRKGKTASIPELLAAYAKLPEAARTQALAIGLWGFEGEDSGPVVEALVAYRDKLPELRALFVGDITYEENEISWINQSDLSALWPSFPKLEQIGVRGGNNLSLGRIRSNTLKSLTIEAGGLPQRVIREALAAEAPNLEHFEVWTGCEDFGGDSAPEDFAALLAGDLFPKLKTLALRDCEYADELAKALAVAPILERIEVLDLSLGNLSDAGAEALATSPLIARLKKLDLDHHYMSDAMMERLRALPLEVELSERADDWDDECDEGDVRAIAVSE
jgi:hypothetical protein